MSQYREKGGETVRAPVNECRAHGRLIYRDRKEEPRDGKAGKNVAFDGWGSVCPLERLDEHAEHN